ncbi:alpha/beta hydrolase family protein [Nocardia sp. NPDC058176]|uniref:alpha/beta hydrolase family protein n=1 Tax=Nocardia sp. NPDC058176 TaxID=3346368 RepID=UPI0036DC2D91
MSVIDAVLWGAAVVFAIVLIAFPRAARRVAPLVLALLVVGAVAQWVLETFYWHLVPVYLLIAVSLAFIFTDTDPSRRRVVFRTGIGVLAAAAIIPWAVPPIPELPEPTGRYAVGSEIFRWVDESRPEPATAATDDRRNVVVQAWYPTDQHSARRWVYIDGRDQLPARVSQLPGFLLAEYRSIDSHASADVPLAQDRAQWPVVLFSPGYGAPRAFYTGLVTDLASRGFIVLAVDHPYESGVTELADGTIATTVGQIADDDPDGTRFMTEHLDTRTADLRFVLDQLTRPEVLGPLADRVDLGTLTATGHSLGGAAALSALAADPRLTAAANIDGTLYGPLPEHTLNRPVLLLESDRSETGHSQRYLDGNGMLLDRLDAPGFRYEINEADHYSFTDVPQFLSAPARFVVTRILGGSRGPAATQRATNDILVPFLTGTHNEIPAAVATHDGISGGPIPG